MSNYLFRNTVPFLKAETLPSYEKCFAITVEKGELTTCLFLKLSANFSQGQITIFFVVSACVFEDFPERIKTLFFSNCINFKKWLT